MGHYSFYYFNELNSALVVKMPSTSDISSIDAVKIMEAFETVALKCGFFMSMTLSLSG